MMRPSTPDTGPAGGTDAGAPQPLAQYDVHEITVTASDDAYDNPWEEVQLQAELTAPSGATISVPGFYYDSDTWKLRFAPAEVGEYQYEYALTGSRGVATEGQGTFAVARATRPGFLRRHATNPYRLVYENGGGLFSGQGFTGCVRDPVSTSFPTPWEDKGYCIDRTSSADPSTCGKTLSEYLDVYVGEMRPSLYRWNVSACSFALWQQLETARPNNVSTPNNYYDVTWGKWGDRLVSELRRRGVRILISPIGFGWQAAEFGNRCGPNFDQDCTTPVCGQHGDKRCGAANAAVVDTNDVQALERYFTYIIARYGAYVDMYEIINEFPLPDATITALARHIRAVDPYGHLIATSWTRPDHPSIELSVPHLYQHSDAVDVDLRQMEGLVAGNLGAGRVYPKATYPMPILAGEVGEPFGTSSNPNFAEDMLVGTRIKLWTAFFNEAGLVLWESSLNHAKSVGGVVFVGPELRAAFRAHEAFAAEVAQDVLPLPMTTLSAGADSVRVYQLRGADALYGYLLHPTANVTAPRVARDFAIEIDAPAAGTLTWYSPEDGAVVGTTPVQSGAQSVAVPAFEIDLAFALAR